MPRERHHVGGKTAAKRQTGESATPWRMIDRATRGNGTFVRFEPRRRWSRAIYDERHPCSQASITADQFAREPRGFPSLRQLLADDLIRCDMLDGQTYAQVRQLLGPPAEGKSRRYLAYVIGRERDSFFQIDPELLYIPFARNGQVVGTPSIFQG